ncbi:hypothetical protein FN846DRAFT_900436 [Sphaerosporella brunnea]|uniref:ABC transmembrane type-1 domain-containing protein n=1 Tax=Sphaerosporella brunnea TaxID=1250544 RepID=A0A5J5ELP8_9PEZI|nr:hypothetical protein FN846DRAFT_900436 [Sphaerosporella brunnea]
MFCLAWFLVSPPSKATYGTSSSQWVSLQPSPASLSTPLGLADLTTIATRTALTGSASYLDVLFLAPGIHRQQQASDVNGGEQPVTAAITTGYIFRVENQATVRFLQKHGRSLEAGVAATLLFLVGPLLTLTAIAYLGAIRDWWGLGSVLALMLARLINVVVFRRRAKAGLASKAGGLLVLLSQDRWIRIDGLVDDLKAVTAGQWLRNMTAVEGFAVAIATTVIYATASLAGNCSRSSILVLFGLLVLSAAFLGVGNEMATKFHTHGRVVTTFEEPIPYSRRLDLARELITEYKRSDWALGLGMLTQEEGLQC